MLFKRRDRLNWTKKLSIVLIPQTSLRRSARYFYLKIARIRDSKYRIAAGFSMGVFMSFSPFIGFHLLLTIFGCFITRASYIAGAFGTIVGNPITFPFIYASTYFVGESFLKTEQEFAIDKILQVLKQENLNPLETGEQIFKEIQEFIMPLLIGWAFIGTVVAMVFFFAMFSAMNKMKNRNL